MSKKLQWTLIVGLVLVATLMMIMPLRRTVVPAQAEFIGHQVLMGGGTAVLLDNGELYDLTMNGWVHARHLPDGVSVENVKVVLSSNRIVEFDGTGWVHSVGGEWKRIPRP